MLACAAAGLALTASLASSLRATAEIAGAPCARDIWRVMFVDRHLHDELRFFATPEQIALLRGLKQGQIYAEARWGAQERFSVGGEPLKGSVAFTDTALLGALCVSGLQGALAPAGPDEAYVRADLPGAARGAFLATRKAQLAIADQVVGFAGIGQGSDVVAWVPYGSASAFGVPLDKLRSSVFVRAQPGATAADVVQALDRIVAANPGVFGDTLGTEIFRSLDQSASTRAALVRLSILSATVAAVFGLLVLINLVLLEEALRDAHQRLHGLWRALGGDAWSMVGLAWTQPTVLAALAAPFAAWLTWLSIAAAEALLPQTGHADVLRLDAALGTAAAVLACYVLLAGGYRYLWTRRPSAQALAQSRNSGRLRPYLLALQSAAACVALSVAAAAIASFVLSMPGARGYDVDDLAVYVVEGGWLSDNPGFVIEPEPGLGVFRDNPELVVGVSYYTMPLLGSEPGGAEVSFGERKVAVVPNLVAGDFFAALRMAPLTGRLLSRSATWQYGTEGPPAVVINETLRRELFGAAAPGVATIGVSSRLIGDGIVAVPIIGVIDEGATGNANPASDYRLQPTIYLPQPRGVWGVFNQYLWVRHPPGYDLTIIDGLADRAAPLLLPEGRVIWSASGRKALAEILSRERGLAWLTTAAAAGALIIAILAQLALLAIQVRQQASEMLVRYAFGDSRRQIAVSFARAAGAPTLAAAALAAGALIGLAPLTERVIGLPAGYGVYAAIIAVGTVLMLSALLVVRQALAVYHLSFVAPLRAD